MRIRSLAASAIVVGLALALTVPTTAGARGHRGHRVKVAGNCTTARAKPRQIIVACADANFYFDKLRWRKWGRHRARGRGVAHANNCRPDCARGHFHHGRARVRLFRPRRCPGQHLRIFTRMSWRLGHHVKGIRRHGRARLFCPIG